MAARPVASGSGHRTCEERRGDVVSTCMHDGGPTGHHGHGAFMGRGRAGGGQGVGRELQGRLHCDQSVLALSERNQHAIRAQSACNQHAIHLAINPSWPEERRVDQLGPIRSCEHENPLERFHTCGEQMGAPW